MMRPDLPADVVALVHRILSPDRHQRPGSARTLHEELGRVGKEHHLGASPFELADCLRELFPESGPRDQGGGDGDATAVGRRADEDVEDLERNTIFYLRRRHPEHDETIGLDLEDDTVDTSGTPPEPDRTVTSDTGQIQEQVTGGSGRRAVVWLLALAAVATAGVGGWLWLKPAVVPVSSLDGGAPPVDLRAVPRADLGGRDESPARDASRAGDIGRTPRAPATLEVKSTPPGAWVKIGGRRLPETTPLLHKAPGGRHRCIVGLKGHGTWSETVLLRRGRTTRVHPRLVPRGGSVTVRSTLSCRVKIKGKLVGEAPVVRHAVEPGRVKVVCLNAALGVREKRKVRVRPGEDLEVRFRFGILNVNVDPWANVTVDGRSRGTTPARLHLSEGEHQVLLRNDKQGLRRRRGVEIKAGKTHRISNW